MNSIWPTPDHPPRRARKHDREAILLAVILLHLIALVALLTMRSPGWPRAVDEPALILLPEPEPADPSPLPPKPSPHAGGSPPAAPARAAMDTSRALIPTVGFAEPVPSVGTAEVGQAPVSGIAVGTGAGGAGMGSGTGGGTGAGDRAGPLADAAPAWVRRITDEELRPLLGNTLKRRGVAVSLLLSCEILLNTRVRDCRVNSETPPGSGIADILPQAARYFRIAPARRDGRIIDGERVEILWQVDIRPARKVEFALPPPF